MTSVFRNKVRQLYDNAFFLFFFSSYFLSYSSSVISVLFLVDAGLYLIATFKVGIKTSLSLATRAKCDSLRVAVPSPVDKMEAREPLFYLGGRWVRLYVGYKREFSRITETHSNNPASDGLSATVGHENS